MRTAHSILLKAVLCITILEITAVTDGSARESISLSAPLSSGTLPRQAGVSPLLSTYSTEHNQQRPRTASAAAPETCAQDDQLYAAPSESVQAVETTPYPSQTSIAALNRIHDLDPCAVDMKVSDTKNL